MARHWLGSKQAQVIRYVDRGKPGAERDRRRVDWKKHGATPVQTIAELLGKGDLDGVFVCAGKNGDDLPLVRELLHGLGPSKFLCHLSTVSASFAAAADEVANQRNIAYANYPLTGGPPGAEAGTMLILAGGPKKLFDELEPALKQLGTPRYFGSSARAGAEVKLIGHLMVFNGQIGVSSAVATHAECFRDGKIGGAEQTALFDFLNEGAGGTKQWAIVAKNGVDGGRWDQGFKIRHAVVDAIYLCELLRERQVSNFAQQSILRLSLAFSYLLTRDCELVTHALMRELVSARAKELDAFIDSHPATIPGVIDSLPAAIKPTVALSVAPRDFA
jgi:3-hydroxyisobutyrate dehydrogenase